MIKKITTLTIFTFCLLLNYSNVNANLSHYENMQYQNIMNDAAKQSSNNKIKTEEYSEENNQEYEQNIDQENLNDNTNQTIDEVIKERSERIDRQLEEMKNAKLPEEPKKEKEGEFLNPYELLFGLL